MVSVVLSVLGFFLVGIPLSLLFSSHQTLACAGGVTVGCLSGIILSPDLDLETITVSEWYVIKTPLIGHIIGPLFIALWMPYARMFAHRSVWTHGPFISTIIRLGYLGCVLQCVQWIFPHIILVRWDISPRVSEWLRILLNDPQHYPFLVGWITGLILSDIGHYGRDKGWIA